MDRNYQELTDALKKHSDRTNHFIAMLKGSKRTKSGMLHTVLSYVSSKRSKSNLQEVSSHAESPHSDQNEKVTSVSKIIKDIKENMETFDKNTDKAVKLLSQYSEASKKEENVKMESEKGVPARSKSIGRKRRMDISEDKIKMETEQNLENTSHYDALATSNKEEDNVKMETEQNVEKTSQNDALATSNTEEENVKMESEKGVPARSKSIGRTRRMDISEDKIKMETEQNVENTSHYDALATSNKEEDNVKMETEQNDEKTSQNDALATSNTEEDIIVEETKQKDKQIPQDSVSETSKNTGREHTPNIPEEIIVEETKQKDIKIPQDNVSETSKNTGREHTPNIPEEIIVEETKQKDKKIPQNSVSTTSKSTGREYTPNIPEADELSVVQVYERDGNTYDFVTTFHKRIDRRYKANVIKDKSNMDPMKPLLVLCQARSRLIIDIDYSLEQFKEAELVSRLGIVIIHSKEKHALPKTSSDCKLGGIERFKDILIIDVAFTKELKFYECKMNKEAILKLQKFLDGETSA